MHLSVFFLSLADPFVLEQLITHCFSQVAAPLNWLGSSYRMIQRAFVDMESMVILMKSDPEIKDDADAVDASEIDRHSLSAAVPEHLRQVHVEFRDVNFSYTANVSVLRNISFRIFTGDSGVSLCYYLSHIHHTSSLSCFSCLGR
jgi:ABC-type transport system involved in Fe-S cluster assembly fused permease/ATPase subunit